MRKIVLLLIAILICGLTFGCAAPTTPVPAQQPSPVPPPPPKVYEKNIPYTVTLPSYDWHEQANILKFQVEAGNRVEVEVAVSKYYLKIPTVTEGYQYNLERGLVTDPYGNVIIQSFVVERNERGQIVFIRGARCDPWRFAFIAATTGEYEVEAFIECIHYDLITDPPPVVSTIKVTVYDE